MHIGKRRSLILNETWLVSRAVQLGRVFYTLLTKINIVTNWTGFSLFFLNPFLGSYFKTCNFRLHLCLFFSEILCHTILLI